MLTVKKGDTVILHMFTGVAVGVKEVIKADKKTFTIQTGKGDTVFDRKTGYQLEPECKSEKYRNYCTENDGSFKEYRKKKKPAKKAKKPSTKKAKNQDEDDEEEDEKPAKKSKSSGKKSTAKKSKKEDEFEDYEDAEEEDEEDEEEE